MKAQLEQYVNLLFAGAADCEDIRQEILQNTLDRYDDLIAEGKVPEAAYRLAIAGIGDVNEILGIKSPSLPVCPSAAPRKSPSVTDTPRKKLLRAIAVGLYIVSFIPLFILSEFGMPTAGLCCTIAIVAVATVLIILGGKKEPEEAPSRAEAQTPQQALRESIGKLIGALSLCIYLLVSFATGAWYITWLIFPIMGAVKGLVGAILDLKEAVKHEN